MGEVKHGVLDVVVVVYFNQPIKQIPLIKLFNPNKCKFAYLIKKIAGESKFEIVRASTT